MFSPTSAEICPPSPSSSSSSSPIFLPVYRKRKASRSPSPLDLSLEVNQPQESRTEFCPTSVTEAKTRWDADEDGTPGPKRISSEDLVKSKLSDYKSCELLRRASKYTPFSLPHGPQTFRIYRLPTLLMVLSFPIRMLLLLLILNIRILVHLKGF